MTLECVNHTIVYSSVTVKSVIGTPFNLTVSMICPSCLMFDSHKGHSVSTIEEGAKTLRLTINNADKDGLLKF